MSGLNTSRSGSVGWMTTGDTQQAYNLAGAIGTFCLLPGVWNRLDVPDLIAMAAPRACMVVGGTEDLLFPPLGQKEATRQIAEELNVPDGTVKSRMHYGMRALRNALDEKGVTK